MMNPRDMNRAPIASTIWINNLLITLVAFCGILGGGIINPGGLSDILNQEASVTHCLYSVCYCSSSNHLTSSVIKENPLNSMGG